MSLRTTAPRSVRSAIAAVLLSAVPMAAAAEEPKPEVRPVDAASSAAAPGAAAEAQADPVSQAAPATVLAPEAVAPLAMPAAAPAVTVAAPAAPPVSAPAPSVSVTSSVAVTSPVVLAVRERLADARAVGDRDERQALTAFYRDREVPLWVAEAGLSARGAAVAAEIAKADDWGLAASAFDLPKVAAAASPAQRADDELAMSLAVLKYARHARGGRLDPEKLSRYFDQDPPLKPAADVLKEIAAAPAGDAYLRGLHPRHPQFEKLRVALLAARSGKAEAPPKATEPNPAVAVPDGPALKPGQSHASIPALRQRLGVPAGNGAEANLYDDKLAEAVKAFQKGAGRTATGTLDKPTRQALNASARSQTAGNAVQRLIANMERWRWVPADMGEFHVWDNIPEYQTRVVDKGKVVHQARIVVGKVETQTPLFSADMKTIVFHPGWGVPDSIKVKELLPYLRPTQSFFGFGETDTSVLRRHNLTVSQNGRPVDPRTINWQQTDIRRYQFIQPPGPSNVLGELKFLFPNKHDVYMHDTSQRHLFKESRRTYSHGCVRVENPRRFAEILLEKDRGMTGAEIARLLASGPKDNQIQLRTRIPVHITYFTAVAEPDGTVKTYADIYGHDARVTAALAGKPMGLEPTSQENAQVARREVKRVKQAQQTSSGGFDLFSGLFGN